MADNVSVAGPVDIRSDSRERVAYDLMMRIIAGDDHPAKNSREYWFKLYHQCYLAVNGAKPDDIMKRG